MKEYSLVIASNFLDHYMFALSLELKEYFSNFYFIASKPLADNYRKLGFSDLNENEFVIKAYEDKEKAREIILNADIVVTGSYAYEKHINERLKKNKIVIFYSERLFKYNKLLNFASAIRNIFRHRYSKESPLLCVSAYAASDYNKAGLFKNRTYKWGYFPKTKKYDDLDRLINSKKDNSIFWAGRLIDWKHPDDAIIVAKKLKKDGIKFTLEIAGNGEMEDVLKEMIISNNLQDCVTMLGSMPPEKIREHMEDSQIYLFTSDSGEGWGVVLNEAMNSACVCIASYSAGSTPFLIDDGINGYVYKNQDIDVLYDRVKKIINDKNKVEIMKNSYYTIVNEWNSQIAAKKLYDFCVSIIKKENQHLYDYGILSKGDIYHE